MESHEILFFFSFFVIRGTGESRNIVVTWVFLVLQQRQKAEKLHAHSPPFWINNIYTYTYIIMSNRECFSEEPSAGP